MKIGAVIGSTLAALALVSPPAMAGLSTDAAGQGQYVTLGKQHGVYAGSSALIVHFAPLTPVGPWARNIAIFDSQSLGGAQISDGLIHGHSGGWHTSVNAGCTAGAFGSAPVCVPNSQAVVATGNDFASDFIVVLDRPSRVGSQFQAWSVRWAGNSDPSAIGSSLEVDAVGPPTVTPEPVTLSFPATGLAGAGGMGFRRRKRQPLA